jgi:hypothetical protein
MHRPPNFLHYGQIERKMRKIREKFGVCLNVKGPPLSFTVSIFTKLTMAELHYVDVSYTDLYQNESKNSLRFVL